MLINKFLLALFSLSIVLAYPLIERSLDEGTLFARANNPPPKTPAKAPAKAPANPPAKAPANPPTKAPPATKGGKSTPVLFTGSDVETQARAANNAPGRNVPKPCKAVSDCTCAPPPSSAKHTDITKSTSCINGFCSCNNGFVDAMADAGVKGVIAAGNSKIVQGIGQTFKVLGDIKDAVGMVAGVFGPEAKYPVKGLLDAFSFGPSHIDDLENGIAGGIMKYIK